MDSPNRAPPPAVDELCMPMPVPHPTSAADAPSHPGRRGRTVMVALDGSAHSRRALDWATMNLLRDGDHLVLAAAATFPPSWGHYLSHAFAGASSNQDKVRAMLDLAHHHVGRTLADAANAVEAATAVDEGDDDVDVDDGLCRRTRPPRFSLEVLPVTDATSTAAPSPATGPLPLPHPKHVLARLCQARAVDVLVVGSLGSGHDSLVSCSAPPHPVSPLSPRLSSSSSSFSDASSHPLHHYPI
ncbi:hypothetical protein HK405_015357, partial [Cladochytrium tenue]